MRVLASDIAKHTGKSVHIYGWLHKKRALGGLMFVLVRDRSGVAQVVIEDETERAKLAGLQVGTVLFVKGLAKSEPRASGGAEVRDPSITVEVPVEDTPPIEIDKPINHGGDHLDTLLEHRSLNIRNLDEQNIFRIQSTVCAALQDGLTSRDFIQVRTPKLLAEATEGGAEVFKLDYFGKTATLAQSPQFYKQILTGAYERVFEIAAAYRAEPSLTTRHLSEFISVDAEMGFIESYSEIEDLLSDLLHEAVECVWSEHKAALKRLGAEKPKLSRQIPKLPLSEVHERYSKAHKHEDTTKEKDLSPSEERWVCEYAAKELGSEAVFITDWPASTMKFYHRKNQSDSNLAVRSDLLFRGAEIVTGSQREHRYEQLISQLRALGGDAANPGYKYYLEAFRYGLPPHGGFGLGLERLTAKIIGLGSVKEATLFPRDMQRLTP